MMLLRRLAYYFRSIFTLLTGITNWPTVIAAFIGLPLAQPFTLQLRTGLHFKARSRMDVWIIKETCLDLDYERLSGPIQADWNIIDIGAGLGDYALGAARCNPHGVVHAYEPFPGSFDLLQQNLRLNQIGNVSAFAEAVSDHTGTLQLEMSGAAVQHRTAGAGQAQVSVGVPAITLSQALARLNGAPCDLLKMDCEGAEYEILMNADEACWPLLKRIVMEYHDGVTAYSHQDLAAFFEKRGCRVRRFPSRVQKNLGFLDITLGQENS